MQQPCGFASIESGGRDAYHRVVISPPALPDRRDADRPTSGFGRLLAAVAPGLVPFALLVIGLVAVGLVTGAGEGRPSSQASSLRPMVTVVSAAAPKASVIPKVEREGTVIAADVDLVSDPAMPGPVSAPVTPRRSGLTDFREAQAPPPPSAPPRSLLRPPRTA